LETEAEQLRKQLRLDEDRLERLSASLRLTKQQIDFFTQETQRALEGIKDANWRFTEGVCGELSKVKSPVPALVEVADKFLGVLEQRECGFKAFQAVCRNYAPLKALMTSVSIDRLSEEQMQTLIPVWKNQQTLLVSLRKQPKGASILAEWLSSCVEYKLRKETLTASLHKLPDLEQKIRIQLQKIAETNAAILVLEEKLLDLRTAITPDSEDEQPLKSASLSLVSVTSTGLSLRQTEDRAIGVVPLQKGTATGGLLAQLSPRSSFSQGKKADFPNFTSQELYGDALDSERGEEEIDVETENELIGCCRSKFFCY